MKRILLRALAVIGVVLVVLIAYVGIFFHKMSVVSVGQPIPRYAEEKAALLVVDVQEGTTGELGTLSMNKGWKEQSGPLIETINKVVEKAQALKIPIVYIRMENKNRLFNLLTGNFLVAGSPSTAIDKRVNVVSSDIFFKSKMDAFWNPQLDAYLREKQIGRLEVTGLDAANCVDRTIKGALQRGYAVRVISDAVIADTVETRDKMFAEYAKAGVTLIPSSDFLSSVKK